MTFLERLLAVLAQLRHSGGAHIVCGDFNIAHKPIDTYNYARNRPRHGPLPEERAWMDTLIERLGWVRCLPRRQTRRQKQYTWWSNWPAAWGTKLGMRGSTIR